MWVYFSLLIWARTSFSLAEAFPRPISNYCMVICPSIINYINTACCVVIRFINMTLTDKHSYQMMPLIKSGLKLTEKQKGGFISLIQQSMKLKIRLAFS